MFENFLCFGKKLPMFFQKRRQLFLEISYVFSLINCFNSHKAYGNYNFHSDFTINCKIILH